MQDSWDFDFETMPRNTRLVLEHCCVSKAVAHDWQPRPDGLHDVIFVRAKRSVDKRRSPPYVSFTPIIRSVASGKLTSRIIGRFAFADNPDEVRQLVLYVADKKAEEMQQEVKRLADQADRRAQDSARYALARAAREVELRAKAASVGVSYEELCDGIKSWDRIRRQTYRPNCCLCCGRVITDPVSVVRGIGPECIYKFPNVAAAMRANVLDIGRLRYTAQALVARLTKAGFNQMAKTVAEEAIKASLPTLQGS